MAIYCPQCATLSKIRSRVGPTGRLVRCDACGTTWLAREYEDDPFRRRAPVAALTDASVVSDAIVIEEKPNAPRIPSGRPKVEAAPVASSFDWNRMQMLGAAFGCLLAIALLSVPLVSALPSVANFSRLPANVEALEFRNVRSETIFRNGVGALIVEGDIVNRSGRSIALPAVRISLKSPAGREVRAWIVEPSTGGLAAGESIGFRSAQLAPSVQVSDVTLSLAAREGDTAGLR